MKYHGSSHLDGTFLCSLDRELELSKIKINPADVDIMVEELEVSLAHPNIGTSNPCQGLRLIVLQDSLVPSHGQDGFCRTVAMSTALFIRSLVSVTGELSPLCPLGMLSGSVLD